MSSFLLGKTIEKIIWPVVKHLFNFRMCHYVVFQTDWFGSFSSDVSIILHSFLVLVVLVISIVAFLLAMKMDFTMISSLNFPIYLQ